MASLKLKEFYRIIEHTADIGIVVEAGDLSGIFVNAAIAMFDIIAQRHEPSQPTSLEKINIVLSSQKADELLVQWLNELLYLSATRGLIFVKFLVNRLDEHNLDITAFGEDKRYYQFKTEIKAATYNDLELRQGESSYTAKVIFDA